ncbi:hypothetical protein J6590_044105 [Homalodisca vitripennis]|nr:hypothetical protein J6590_044105 [Homalodisca vitripennis]
MGLILATKLLIVHLDRSIISRSRPALHTQVHAPVVLLVRHRQVSLCKFAGDLQTHVRGQVGTSGQARRPAPDTSTCAHASKNSCHLAKVSFTVQLLCAMFRYIAKCFRKLFSCGSPRR